MQRHSLQEVQLIYCCEADYIAGRERAQVQADLEKLHRLENIMSPAFPTEAGDTNQNKYKNQTIGLVAMCFGFEFDLNCNY